MNKDNVLNTYTLYWLTGKRETVQGTDPAQAMTQAGYSNGALRALDFYADGDDHSYEWDASKRNWLKKNAPTESALFAAAAVLGKG